MISQKLDTLTKVLEEHRGAPVVQMDGDSFEYMLNLLAVIREDVRALENTIVPPAARITDAPPWGWGGNVVPLCRSGSKPEGVSPGGAA
jgi:hypothetical protein